jgi:hypothetical protein
MLKNGHPKIIPLKLTVTKILMAERFANILKLPNFSNSLMSLNTFNEDHRHQLHSIRALEKRIIYWMALF